MDLLLSPFQKDTQPKLYGPGYYDGNPPEFSVETYFDINTGLALPSLQNIATEAIEVARKTPYIEVYVGEGFTVVDCLVIGGTARGEAGDLDLFLHVVNTKKGPIHVGHSQHYKAANVAVTRAFNRTDNIDEYIAKFGKAALVDIFLSNYPPDQRTIPGLQRGSESFYSLRYNKWVKIKDWWTIQGAQAKWSKMKSL